MRKRFILVATLLITALCLSVNEVSMARPARRGKMVFRQPDGSSFVGSIHGDEFFRLKLTEKGESIIQDEDGWWCYAAYDALGNKYSSGVKVGVNDIAAKSASRQIPYSTLIQKASVRRAEFNLQLARRRESMRAQTAAAATKSTAGPVEKHGIIILAEYSDVSFTYSKQNFVDMISQQGYSYNGANGSAKDYFEAQFGNMYNFSFDVSDIVRLPNNRKYYGQNVGSDESDFHPQQMVSDACTLAASSGVDFSKYDDDGDGYVDTVFVIFAGDDEADSGNEDCIWAHAWSLSKAITLGGKKIYSYACASELGREVTFDKWGNYVPGDAYLAGIGTFCHEYSHTFGLADLYDTDYTSNSQAEALWNSTGLMDGGNMNNKGNTPPNWNAIDRIQLGVGNCITLESGQYNLKPISENGDYCKLETGTSGEYYLIECRDNNNVFDSYIGGSGLLVYHIDRTSTAIRKYWDPNMPNAYASHQCADLIEADETLLGKYKSGTSFYFSPTVYESHYNDLYRLFYPFNEVNYLSSSYALTSWYGAKIDARIENIRKESDGSVSFSVVDFLTVTPFQSEALVEVRDLDSKGPVSLKYTIDGSTQSITLQPDANDSQYYCTMLKGLAPNTQYTIELTYTNTSGVSSTNSKTFRTLDTSDLTKICMEFAVRNADGSFPKGAKIPLVMLNAQSALNVEWYFNSNKISTGSDYKWAIPSSGELKAVVSFPEGDVCIYKKIIVK